MKDNLKRSPTPLTLDHARARLLEMASSLRAMQSEAAELTEQARTNVDLAEWARALEHNHRPETEWENVLHAFEFLSEPTGEALSGAIEYLEHRANHTEQTLAAEWRRESDERAEMDAALRRREQERAEANATARETASAAVEAATQELRSHIAIRRRGEAFELRVSALGTQDVERLKSFAAHLRMREDMPAFMVSATAAAVSLTFPQGKMLREWTGERAAESAKEMVEMYLLAVRLAHSA